MPNLTPAVAGRVSNGKTSNSSKILFMPDTNGLVVLLKAAGIDAASRIAGSPEKLKVYLDTLLVLSEHAKAKMGAQVNERKDYLEDVDVRAKAAHDLLAEERARDIAAIERSIVAQQELLAAKQAE